MGGDGIGPEVIDAGLEVLKLCAERDGGFTLDFEHFGWGSDYYRKHAVMMPDDGADQLRNSTPSFSAPSAIRTSPTTSPVGPAPGDLPAARPVRQCAPHTHPARHHLPAARRRRAGSRLGDRARELARASMPAYGGRVHRGLPIEVATGRLHLHARRRERIMRFAFELARDAGRASC